MTMEIGTLANKLKQLFEKISEANYVLDNFYADSLLNKIKRNASDISTSGKVSALPELVLKALPHLDSAHMTVKVFIIRLLAIICHNELHFTQIFTEQEKAIDEAFQKIGKLETMPSTRVAYLELALALTTHRSGASWLSQSQAWKHIYDLCLKNQTVFVLHQAYDCLAKLLWKLSDCEEEGKLKNILDYILVAIMQHPYHTIKSMTNEEEYEITKKFEPTLQTVLRCMSDNVKVQKRNTLVNLFINSYNLNSHIYAILSLTQREEIMHMLAKLVFMLVFSKIFITKPIESCKYVVEDFLELTVSYYNTLQFFVKKRLVVPLLDYCNTCCIIWSEAWSCDVMPTFTEDVRVFDFENQLVFMLLAPVIIYVKSEKPCNQFDQTDHLNQFIFKIVNANCEHTARTAYSFRYLMQETDSMTMTLNCVKRLSCLKSHLNSNAANLVFQAMYHVLCKYVPREEDNETEENYEDSSGKVLVMTYVMDTIYTLVKSYDISWHESVETVSLYNQVYYVLKRKNLTCRFVVTALNLITVTVKKFLPPNLSLLMDTKPGSAIDDLGKLINEKLHDPHWEIRDSALELLFVCTDLSFVKYTPFQKQIIDNNLLVVATTIALNDYEVYVQASAVKCVSAATKVPSIWNQLLSNFPDIQDKLVTQFCKNPEGIVRKEVVHVIIEMWENLKLTTEYKNTLYEHMVSTAINDFHWEVQIAALQFWRVVIKSLYAEQGMLDGTFPSVTFSKETRKIVTLNEHEIQKLLIKTVQDLANMGCLTVLVKLLDEDIDVDIMDNAYNISLELINILHKYNIKRLPDLTSEQQMVLTDSISEVVPVGLDTDMYEAQDSADAATKSDSVIESILNAKDINLLSSIYQKQMHIEGETKEETDQPKVKYHKYVSANLFLNVLNGKDFKSLIEEKRRWKEGIRSMSSLLDDILGIYECSNEINDLDCY